MLEESKSKKMKGLSKAIYIIANIIKVFTIIGIVGVIIGMCLIPLLTKNIKITDKDITIFNEKVTYEQKDNDLIIKNKDNEEFRIAINNEELFNKVLDGIKRIDMNKVTITLELTLTCTIASLIIFYLINNHLHKLFKNIYKNETQFNIDNSIHLKKMAIYLLITLGITYLSNTIISIGFGTDIGSNLDLSNIIISLILFALSYIFEYGYNLDNKKAN